MGKKIKNSDLSVDNEHKEKPTAKRIKGKDLSIKNLPALSTEKDYLFEGGNGFGLRVRPSGKKLFFYKFRFKGKLRFMNLGVYPNTSYADANKKHGVAYKLRKDGIDPIETEKEEQRQKLADELNLKSANMTVKCLIDLYLALHSRPNKKTYHKDELVLKQVDNEWGTRLATDLTKLDLTCFLQKIIKAGAPGQAQNILESVRALYNWAVDDGYLLATPFIKVRRPSKKKTGSRKLDPSEIKQLWYELDAAKGMSSEIKRGLKLTLVTAQRAGECISIHRAEIDGNWWTIPAAKTKNRKEHHVYLTDMALELIGPLEYIDLKTGEIKDKEYIFPCPHKKKKQPISEGSMGNALRRNYDSVPLQITVNKFTPHDLRRTAITNFARLKVIKEWRERIINHLPEALDATYNLYEYDDEKETSMLKWESDLRRILELPAKVGEQD